MCLVSHVGRSQHMSKYLVTRVGRSQQMYIFSDSCREESANVHI